jgi:signal transduction histidine kinase
MRILIVEDGALDRAVLAALLRDRGHEITEVGDGERGWELLQRNRYELLFTDLRLPGMDGLELLGQVGTLPEEARPHSVVITGSSRAEDLKRALERGAHDYLLKTSGVGALEVRVTIAEQAATIRAQQRRGAQLQRLLYRISEAASGSETLQVLFGSIHAAIDELMEAPNFYIALADPGTGQLEYPYWAGEGESPALKGRLAALAEHVLKTGEALVAPPAMQRELCSDAEPEVPIYWVGVPLRRRREAFGMLAVFSHAETLRIGREEADVLAFVSEQVATAVERKRAEEALRRSERMAAMGGLVAGVAHEIRNPLFGLSAAVDAFEKRYGEGGEEMSRYLERMRSQLDRVSQLMQDLLEYGKPYEPILAEEQLPEILEEALDAVRPLARERRVELRVRASGDLPTVRVDRRRIVHVFVNLLDNAVRHSPGAGLVEVSVAPQPDGARLVCSVRDSGEGFRPEVLTRVFEPFFTRRRGGTGLGLAIVQRIAEEHGGTVKVGNAPGGGALVEVSLPLTRSRGPAARRMS